MASALDFNALRREALEAKRAAAAEAAAASIALAAGEEEDQVIAVDLDAFRVGSLERAAYVSDFVSVAESARQLRAVEDYSKVASRSHTLTNRVVQNVGGTPHAGGMLPVPLPPFLRRLSQRLVQAGIFPEDRPPNHALVNTYTCGQGIAMHKDGPLYWPRAAILSLESPAVLRFERPAGEGDNAAEAARLLLQPRSLLVFDGPAFDDLLHGIESLTEDAVSPETVANAEAAGILDAASIPRGRRVSITLRHAFCQEREALHTPAEREEATRRERQWIRGITDGHEAFSGTRAVA